MTEKRSWREMAPGTVAREFVRWQRKIEPILDEERLTIRHQTAAWLAELDYTANQSRCSDRWYEIQAGELLAEAFSSQGWKVRR